MQVEFRCFEFKCLVFSSSDFCKRPSLMTERLVLRAPAPLTKNNWAVDYNAACQVRFNYRIACYNYRQP